MIKDIIIHEQLPLPPPPRERRRVPRKVVVDDVAALAVQVDAFLADCGDNEDLRYQRRVEAHEEPVSLRAGSIRLELTWDSGRGLAEACSRRRCG